MVVEQTTTVVEEAPGVYTVETQQETVANDDPAEQVYPNEELCYIAPDPQTKFTIVAWSSCRKKAPLLSDQIYFQDAFSTRSIWQP